MQGGGRRQAARQAMEMDEWKGRMGVRLWWTEVLGMDNKRVS